MNKSKIRIFHDLKYYHEKIKTKPTIWIADIKELKRFIKKYHAYYKILIK